MAEIIAIWVLCAVLALLATSALLMLVHTIIMVWKMIREDV